MWLAKEWGQKNRTMHPRNRLEKSLLYRKRMTGGAVSDYRVNDYEVVLVPHLVLLCPLRQARQPPTKLTELAGNIGKKGSTDHCWSSRSLDWILAWASSSESPMAVRRVK